MSYSPTLGSVFNRTKMRDPSHVCSFSGMCAMCTADCIGSCEIGLSAVRGMETVYPTTTGENQIASEKVYPVDYSHFNINGRSFGAMGAPLDADRATIYHVGLEREIGTLNPVKLALPIILPALIKLNWPDYFGGAAMAGVNAVIGEGAVSKDPTLAYENGKVVHAPKLREMLDAFNKYDRGYGQIILQANYDDDAQGVPEYAIRECGAKAIEFKFGQSAKGIKCVSMNEPFFPGHFPGQPIMPGVLILEALAQTGAVAALSLPENQGKLALFGGVKNARFRRQVVPGDVLTLECELVEQHGPIGIGKATAWVGNERAANAELTFVIADA